MSARQPKYIPLPELSPYTKKNRYENPKETFKAIIRKIKQTVDVKMTYDVVDVGCANGEFIYTLKKGFPRWNYIGYDMTEEFIKTALSFEGLEGVRFECKDMFDIEDEQFDLVCCLGTIQIFDDVEKPLRKLLSICKEGGYLFVEGLFNKYDVDVRVQFCDNSMPQSKGLWRADFNYHSRTRIREQLENEVAALEFEDIEMGVEIPNDPKKPAVNVFTFRDEAGKNIITSGLNLILNNTLMTIKK
jgi:SAM-dependent methyltransferase